MCEMESNARWKSIDAMMTDLVLERDRVQSLRDSSKLVLVECRLRKPCWCLLMRLCCNRKSFSSADMMDSSILQAVQVRAIGR